MQSLLVSMRQEYMFYGEGKVNLLFQGNYFLFLLELFLIKDLKSLFL